MFMHLQAIARLTSVVVIALCAIQVPVGCKSAEVQIDGTSGGLIGPRRVKVGETFTVSQAFDPKTGADWKLGNYDRTRLEPVTRQPYITEPDGSMRRIYEFKAKSPGMVELVFLQRNREPVTPGVQPPPPKTETHKVKIVE